MKMIQMVTDSLFLGAPVLFLLGCGSGLANVVIAFVAVFMHAGNDEVSVLEAQAPLLFRLGKLSFDRVVPNVAGMWQVAL